MSIGFGLLLYPFMVFVVGTVVSLILQAVSGNPVQAPEQVPSHLSVVGSVVTVIYAVVVAPIHEELFFRGILYRSVRDRYGLVPGLLATGVAFGLIHYLPGAWQDTLLLMGVMFVNGMALAWWYERRGTIVSSIVAHMVFNVIGIVLIFGTR
jgi:membrane protease YdiL (CAAX protease family)